MPARSDLDPMHTVKAVRAQALLKDIDRLKPGAMMPAMRHLGRTPDAPRAPMAHHPGRQPQEA